MGDSAVAVAPHNTTGGRLCPASNGDGGRWKKQINGGRPPPIPILLSGRHAWCLPSCPGGWRAFPSCIPAWPPRGARVRAHHSPREPVSISSSVFTPPPHALGALRGSSYLCSSSANTAQLDGIGWSDEANQQEAGHCAAVPCPVHYLPRRDRRDHPIPRPIRSDQLCLQAGCWYQCYLARSSYVPASSIIVAPRTELTEV